MRNYLFLLLTGIILLSCNPEAPSPVSPEKVEQKLIAYFQAIEDNDFEKMQTLITEDYILYEDGLIWNNDSLIKGLKGYLTAFPGATFDYRLSNFKTTVGMNVATTYYQNEGKMITPDSTFQFNWIESAFFVKEENEWKISFLHSTVKKGR